MPFALKPVLFALALGFAGAAQAADPPMADAPPAPATATAAMPMKMDSMGGGMMDMAGMHCMGLTDARLAALKTDLNITPGQERAWTRFVVAIKAAAPPMSHPMATGPKPGAGMMMGQSLPDRLAHHEAMMKTHLKHLQKIRAAITGLYAALTPEQRAAADKLLCGGMGGPAQ